MAPPSSKSLLLLLLILCLSSALISPSSSNTITLYLSPNLHHSSSSENPLEFISNIADSTLNRAYHLNHHNINTSTTSVFARIPGAYSINLPIGTPPQNIPAVVDTASSLVWVPCTSHYACDNICTDLNATVTVFKPKRSSSKQSINCSNKKCRWLDQPDAISSCRSCTRSLSPGAGGSCSAPCAYVMYYEKGDTAGHAITDNFNFQENVVRDFFLGCSSFTELAPRDLAIVGFGRNPMSLPSQLKLNKFSYCLGSHHFNNAKSGKLILGDTDGTIRGVKYTPLLKNPSVLPYNEYYYVQLEEITVGRKTIKIPNDKLSPDAKGNGGTVVDSGSTLTSIDSSVFDPIVKEYTAQLSPAQRKRFKLSQSSLGGNVLCVDTRGERERVEYPEMVFKFKGGVEMDIPVANYFKGTGNYLCLPFVNATTGIGLPAVILGNTQQQNFHIEFDLLNERLGLKRQICA